MVDFDCFPHILDSIIDNASYETLVALRATSKYIRSRADARIYRHVVFDTHDKFHSYLQTHPTRRPAATIAGIVGVIRVVDLLTPKPCRLSLSADFKVDVVRQYSHGPGRALLPFFGTAHIIWVDVFPPHQPFSITPRRTIIDARHVSRGETLVVHVRFLGGGIEGFLPQLSLDPTTKRIAIIFSQPYGPGSDPRPNSDFLMGLADVLSRYVLSPFDMHFTFVDLNQLTSEALGFNSVGYGNNTEWDNEHLHTQFLRTVKHFCVTHKKASPEQAETRTSERFRFISSNAWRDEVGQELYDLAMSE